MKHSISSREDWLNAAVAELRPRFASRGYKIPDKIRVSVGFPGAGRRPGKRYEAPCWVAMNGKDGAFDVFISPMLDNEEKVIASLAHNLLHAVVGLKAMHREPFRDAAAIIGLEPPWNAINVNSAFKVGLARPTLAAIGEPYPHSRLSPGDLHIGSKTQTTRLLKCSCLKCGYITRTSQKWLALSGAPHCPTPSCNNRVLHIEDEEGQVLARRKRNQSWTAGRK